MKIAHLILTHKNPEQVKMLIEALTYPGASFFIHVDKKTPLEPFRVLESENVKLIQNRTPIYWAGWGTIQATLNGFQEILVNDFDYINVISGQDFPAQSPASFHSFLAEKKDQQFITCESVENEWKEAAHRVKQYHFINWRIPGKFRISKAVSCLLPDRKFPYPFEIVGRANWFTLTSEACKFILDFSKKERKYNAFFKWCWGADEFYFSTILFNSPFRPFLEPNLVYVDWRGQTEGHPRMLTLTDLPEILQSGKFFARKIELGKDQGLIDALKDHITR